MSTEASSAAAACEEGRARVFTSTFGGGVFISRDGGTTWAPANSGISDLETTALVMSSHFERDSTLLAASANAGVFKSTDEGRSWSPMAAIGRHLDHDQSSVHFRALALAPDGASDVVFLGMYEGFWKSAGAGSTWQFVDLFPSHLIRSFAMSPDYPNDHTLFASTYGGGIVATFDGGQTWTFLNTGLSNPWADPMAISPDFSTDRTVFSGTIWGPQRCRGDRRELAADEPAWSADDRQGDCALTAVRR